MEKILEKIEVEKDSIKKINLSSKYAIDRIPDIIRSCHKLEKLNISYTGITAIPKFVFQLPNLKELNYLGCRKLIKQPNSFNLAPRLEKLSIFLGKNHAFDPEIAGLPSLKSLTISGELKTLPKSVYSISSLKELHLLDTNISTLSSAIKNLKKLTKISLWQALFMATDQPFDLNLNEIFRNLSGCLNLKELRLDNNGHVTIPKSISVLKNLQVLSAKNNMLVSFPREIYDLSLLKEIDLGINQLKQIPKGIENLEQLKILRLNSNWKNKLDTKNLFDVIHRLQNLEVLELWSCQSIKEIPESISSLKKLKKLDLDNNLLEKLPESIFSMNHLKQLRVSTNKLSFDEIEKLKRALLSTKIIA